MERMESTEKELATPSNEVREKPQRRRFSAEYKLRILAEPDGCTEMGQVGKLLRREGLHSSLLSTWRRQREEGVLAGLTPKRRGRTSPRQPRALRADERQGVLDLLHSPRFVDKSPGPAKWTYYHLYVILDIYSVTKSHSRPHVSNDNPFSESQFKTLKYRPGFPDRFGSQQDARAFCGEFFRWYNDEHYHSGLGMLTPGSVHYGHAEEILARRVETLDAAYAAHPKRFVGRRPRPPALPEAVWINPPVPSPDNEEKGLPTTVGSQQPDAPSAHPRSGYPSPGCVPAEPGFVSPNTLSLPETVVLQHPPSDTRVIPKKIPEVWGLAPRSKEDCSQSESKTH